MQFSKFNATPNFNAIFKINVKKQSHEGVCCFTVHAGEGKQVYIFKHPLRKASILEAVLRICKKCAQRNKIFSGQLQRQEKNSFMYQNQ